MPKSKNHTSFFLSVPKPNEQYLHIECKIMVSSSLTEILLPSWRPGRYEISNFAKNVRGFKIYNEKNKNVSFQKKSKDSWLVDSSKSRELRIQYQYYSNELNAGSSYVSEDMLYVNPVNCLIHTRDLFEQPIVLELDLPQNWKIATSLEKNNNTLLAASFDALYDAPFICAATLVEKSYKVGAIKFNIWFNNLRNIPWEKVLSDFEKFTKKQIKDFGEFPSNAFHFLIHTPPFKAYHGVEHKDSTVIALGPSYDVFGRLYKELLGVSSHELYHVWNVKSIRPNVMSPYKFREENYSRLGYVYEGITTYMGDLYLLKSGVFTITQYLKELEQQFQRHFDNPARFYTSVGDSSFDTWLDGYEMGAPGRKLSIYVEGCLLAFVTDYLVRKSTENVFGIEEVMKRLYTDKKIKSDGFDEADYKRILEETSGISFDAFFDNYMNGTYSYEPILQDALEYFGLEMKIKDPTLLAEGTLGIKLFPSSSKHVIHSLALGSPAEMCGLRNRDEIIAVNDMSTNGDLESWLQYFNINELTLTLVREQKIIVKKIPAVHKSFFPKYSLHLLSKKNKNQLKALHSWTCDGSL